MNRDKDNILKISSVKKEKIKNKIFFIKIKKKKKINYFKVKGKHQYYNKESWKAWYKFIDPK